MTTLDKRRCLRPLDSDSWIARVLGMIERLGPGLMRSGDAADYAKPALGKSPLPAATVAEIRRRYSEAAQLPRPVDAAAIARRAGVSVSTVRNHTRDLRRKAAT